nr:uncharacterized protein LOC123764160 [Procambarus clarkii]
MLKLGLTQQDVAGGEVVGGKHGQPLQLKVGERLFPLPEPEQAPSSVVVFHSDESEEPYLLDLKAVGNLTLQSFREDPTLVGVPPPSLAWSTSPPCHLRDLLVNVTPRHVVVAINNNTVSSVQATKRNLVLVHEKNATQGPEKDLWQGGLLLLVVNPRTCQVTLSQVFYTSDFGAQRELSWTLKAVQRGRLVVIASLHDGSLLLGPARQDLHNLGSAWASHYLYRDSWAWVFIMGGMNLAETISPNIGNSSVAASPLLLRVEFPPSPLEGQRLAKRGRKKPETSRKETRRKVREDGQKTGARERGTKGPEEPEVLVNEAPDKGRLVMREDLTENGRPEERLKTENITEEEQEEEGDVDEEPEEELTGWRGCAGGGRRTTRRKAAWRAFCDTHDGYGNLCGCEDPLALIRHPHHARTVHWREDIPIIIIAGNRTRYLYRLLESVGQQADLRSRLVLVVTDGVVEGVLRLARVLALNVLIHRPEGTGATRVSRNLRFAFFNALRLFPRADKFIVVEDDLVLSPDFYSYMQQTGWVLDNDPTVYCVSAFNHLSYAHTAHDPARLYRVQSFPSYGWMVNRDTLAYILPKWLPSNVTHDWDYFLESSIMRRGRECLVPDVNRAYHGGGSGLHLTVSWSTERDYLARPFNHQPNITVMNLTGLLQEQYEAEMVTLAKTAVPLDVNDLLENTTLLTPGGVYVVYVAMDDASDVLAFRDVGDKLGVWSRDVRESHHHTWRLYYHNATLLVVGTPASRYSRYRRRGTPVMGAPVGVEDDLRLQETLAWVGTPVFTHADLPYLPLGGIRVPLTHVSFTNRSLGGFRVHVAAPPLPSTPSLSASLSPQSLQSPSLSPSPPSLSLSSSLSLPPSSSSLPPFSSSSLSSPSPSPQFISSSSTSLSPSPSFTPSLFTSPSASSPIITKSKDKRL